MRGLLRLLFAMFICTRAAEAARVEVLPVFEDGSSPPKAAACFFRAGDRDDFFSKFLSSNDVRCLPADKVLDLPIGSWNVFAVSEGFVTSHPVQIDVASADPSQLHRLELTLRRAGVIDFGSLPDSLASDEWIAVYVMNNGRTSPGAFRPLPDGETSIVVPANDTLVPVVISSQGIRRVGRPMSVGDSQTVVAPAFGPDSSHFLAVLLRVQADVEFWNLSSPPHPELLLRMHDRVVKPVMKSSGGLDRTLAIFRDIGPGEGELLLNGKGYWIKSATKVAVAPPQQYELKITPAGVLRVSLDMGSAIYLRPSSSCDGSEDVEVSILVKRVCEGEDCGFEKALTSTARNALDGFVIEELPAGDYSVQASVETFPFESHDLQVVAGSDSRITLARKFALVAGKLTRNGERLVGQIRADFRTFGTDENGDFVFAVKEVPFRKVISARPCTGGRPFSTIPGGELVDGSRFEIDIPQNETKVRVVDATTATPISHADVVYNLLDAADNVILPGSAGPTSDSGDAIVADLDPKGRYSFCASAENFEQGCSDAMTIGADAITITLTPIGVLKGRIPVSGAVKAGRLSWLRPDGAITESVLVASDGSFTYRAAHDFETFAFTSATHPLVVMRTPQKTEADLALPVPNAAATGIAVAVQSNATPRSGVITLSVGGTTLPLSVFLQHQIWRGSVQAPAGGSVVIGPVLTTENIVVLRGPGPEDLPPGTPPDLDVFTSPHFAALIERRVPTNGQVNF
jgi:hypothetical protein